MSNSFGRFAKFAVAAMAGFLVAALSACVPGATEASDGQSVKSSGVKPVINEEVGIAVFGSSRYSMSEYQSWMLVMADAEAMEDCFNENGLEGQIDRSLPSNLRKMASDVGVWRVADAEEFAFTTPMTANEQRSNGIPNDVRSRADRESLDESDHQSKLDEEIANEWLSDPRHEEVSKKCRSDSGVNIWARRTEGDLGVQGGPWRQAFFAAWDEAFEDDRMLKVQEDYAKCLDERDIKLKSLGDTSVGPTGLPSDRLFRVEGQDDMRIDEQQIKLAVNVVECKTESDAVRRVLDVVADYEEPVYTNYEDELLEERRRLEESAAAAEKFWAERA